MSTVSDKLTSIYDTKVKLKAAIERKGGVMTDNMPFSNYPSAIDGLNVLPPQTPSNTWEKNSTWWDIKTILENDVNATYANSYIVLIKDTELTTSFSGGVAYKTSDGAYYTSTSVTHIWDTTQDKDCNEGYKTRYVIVYVASATVNTLLTPIHILGLVCKCNVSHISNSTVNNIVSSNVSTLLFWEMLDGFKLIYSYSQSGAGFHYLTSRMYDIKIFPTVYGGTYIYGLYMFYWVWFMTMYFPGKSLTIEIPYLGTAKESEGVSEGLAATDGNQQAYGISLTLSASLQSFTLLRKTAGVTQQGGGAYYRFASLYVSGSLNTSGTIYGSAPEKNESLLTTINLPYGILWGRIDIRNTRAITLAAIRHIIDVLQDNTGKATKYFYVNSYTNDKMTTADKLLIASKNWTLSVISMSS